MTDEPRSGALGRWATCRYFDAFPRPLFVVNDPQRLKVKGLVGNT